MDWAWMSSRLSLFRHVRKRPSRQEPQGSGTRRARVGLRRTPRLGHSIAGQRAHLHHCSRRAGEFAGHHFCVPKS